jgi:protein-S-isoprenylcysteine O-methyltransferase Ste14
MEAPMIPVIDPWKLVYALWLALCIVWGAGLLATKPTLERQSPSARLPQSAVLLLGFWMLFAGSVHAAWLDLRIHEPGRLARTAGLALTLAGIPLAIWARLALGANWSGVPARKQGHTLIRRGPYCFVRHPIYTGILTASAGAALLGGSLHNLLAPLFIFLAFWLNIETEEKLMVSTFGAEYVDYKKRVKTLVPYLF